MTDLAHPVAAASDHRPDSAIMPGVRKYVSYPCVVVAFALSFALGRWRGHDNGPIESSLLILMEFMAALKFLAAFAGAAATRWRLTFPVRANLALLYMATVATMAAGAGLIASLGAIVFGAGLFHVGLLGFLFVAWRDDDARRAVTRP